MRFSRLPATCWRAVLLLAIAQLYACGSDGQHAGDTATTPTSQLEDNSPNANISVSEPDTFQLALDVSIGGYVINNNVTLFCSEQFSYCNTDVDANSIETLHAVSRFGHTFSGWRSSDTTTSDSAVFDAATLDVNITTDTRINASFQSTLTSDAMSADSTNWSCENQGAAEFRALHLGDSLTLGPTLVGESSFYVPEPKSIAFYEQGAGRHVTAPLVLSMYGLLIAGPRNGSLDQPLPQDHYWKQATAQQNTAANQFNAVVIALGSNDATDVINGLDADFVIEQRVKPLLQWLGNKPVYWILPHYARWPTAMQNIHFSGTQDGLDCGCNSAAAHTGSQCNIVDEMQSCSVDPDMQQQTIAAFRAIHALRERLAALQDEYENLIVIDPAQTIAAASNDQHDLYATMSPTMDTIHFSLQGAEWYAWLHAWLAIHADSNCALTALPKWQMGTSEIAMAAQLDIAP